MTYVLFTKEGVAGWFGDVPVAGAEWVEGVDEAVLCTHRRTTKGSWVLRPKPAVTEPAPEDLAADRSAAHEAAVAARRVAVREALACEADPLFFQWQRGEASEADWLAAVATVKVRYPKPDPV
jgi:hypothetical protein